MKQVKCERKQLEIYHQALVESIRMYIKVDAKFLAPNEVISQQDWEENGFPVPEQSMTYQQLREWVYFLNKQLDSLERMAKEEPITVEEQQELLSIKILADAKEIQEYPYVSNRHTCGIL